LATIVHVTSANAQKFLYNVNARVYDKFACIFILLFGGKWIIIESRILDKV